MSVRCSFYILNRDDPYDSKSLWPKVPGGAGLVLAEPPAVGDLIILSGETADPEDPEGERLIAVNGVWKVLARQWGPAAYGSAAWPYGSGPEQPEPVILDLVIERMDGEFPLGHHGAAAAR